MFLLLFGCFDYMNLVNKKSENLTDNRFEDSFIISKESIQEHIERETKWDDPEIKKLKDILIHCGSSKKKKKESGYIKKFKKSFSALLPKLVDELYSNEKKVASISRESINNSENSTLDIICSLSRNRDEKEFLKATMIDIIKNNSLLNFEKRALIEYTLTLIDSMEQLFLWFLSISDLETGKILIDILKDKEYKKENAVDALAHNQRIDGEVKNRLIPLLNSN